MTRDLAAIAAQVQDEYHHEVGIAILLTKNEDGWSYAAIEPSTGTVLAWDGRYSFMPQDQLPSEDLRGALGDLDWQRNATASRIIAEQNAAWLPILGGLLCPSWSLTQLATRLLDVRLIDGGQGVQDRGDRAVAYFPTGASAPTDLEGGTAMQTSTSPTAS